MKLFRFKSDNRINKGAKKPLKKTKANSGETLIEVLVSILIISLSIALLVMTISSSTNIIKKSHDKFETYYNATNELEAQTVASASGEVTLTLVSAEDGISEASRTSANNNLRCENTKVTEEVNYYVNDAAKRMPVASYKIKPTNNGTLGN